MQIILKIRRTLFHKIQELKDKIEITKKKKNIKYVIYVYFYIKWNCLVYEREL
jgi:hypothetical protein